MGGGLKHVLVAKFKDEIPPQKVEELIACYSQFVTTNESVKAFHWGTDVSKENYSQGFTHVFEATFESVECVAAYTAHPGMAELTTKFNPALEKYVVITYEPIIVKP